MRGLSGWRGAVVVLLAALGAVHLNRYTRHVAVDLSDRLAPPLRRVTPETSWVSLGAYRPHEPTREDALPASVRRELEAVLEAHVGGAFRRRLRFVHAQVVDHADPIAQAFARRARWPVFASRVGFLIPVPAEGVEGFIGYVTLYPGHTRPAVVEFPPVRTRPDLARLVPLRDARDTAARHGVVPVHARLQYDATHGQFVYVLTGRYRDLGQTGTEDVVVIAAHTGRVLRTGRNHWIE